MTDWDELTLTDDGWLLNFLQKPRQSNPQLMAPHYLDSMTDKQRRLNQKVLDSAVTTCTDTVEFTFYAAKEKN
jgi:hypothetical protein